MNTAIYYYTGTGNSLWTARKIADQIGGADLISLPSVKEETITPPAGAVGLVFPVYIWGVPAPVIRFVDKLRDAKPEYLFAVAVNGGQASNTLVQLKKLLAEKGLALSAGFSVKTPSNYIPWGGPGPKEKLDRLFAEAGDKIKRIAADIREKKVQPVEKGPLWQRIVFTWLYNMSFPRVPEMDKSFWTDEKCDGCGICAKVCPAANVSMQDGKPAWNRRCEQCFACLQWCPKEAIQYGKKTPKYQRYHHPEIALKDVLKSGQ
jgi:ferredoxin/flavodoxin